MGLPVVALDSVHIPGQCVHLEHVSVQPPPIRVELPAYKVCTPFFIKILIVAKMQNV